MGEYLTVHDIATRLEVTTDTVRRWLRMGDLKGTLFGRAGYRVEEQEFRLFMYRRGSKFPSTSPLLQTEPLPRADTVELNVASLSSPSNTQITDLVHDAVIVRDLLHMIKSWNRAAEQLYGWQAQDAIGQNASMLLQTAFPTSQEEVEIQLLQHGYWEGTLQNTHRDGHMVTVQSRQMLLRDEQGHLSTILEIHHDITLPKRLADEKHILAECTRILLSATDTTTMLQHIAKLVVPTLADFCYFDLLQTQNTLQHISWKCGETSTEDTHAISWLVPTFETLPHPISYVLKNAQPLIVPVTDETYLEQTATTPEYTESISSLQACSLITVPLLLNAHPHGTLTFGYTTCSGRHYTREDLTLPLTLADLIVQTIDRIKTSTEQQKAQRQAETQLREISTQQARLEFAQAVSKIGTFEWDVQTDTLFCTPELEALYGLKPGSITNAQQWFQYIVPADRAAVEHVIHTTLQTGNSYTMEFRILHPDNSQHWIQSKGKVLTDQVEHSLRIIGTNSDITAQKQAEESVQPFASLIENSVDFISITTLNGKLHYLNQAGCSLVGLTDLDEARTKTIFEFLPEQYRELFTEIILPSVISEGRWEGDLHLHHLVSKQMIQVHQTIFTIAHPQTEKTMLALIAHDIHEQKELEQRRDAFISMASHELRNPLTTIQANLQLAERRVKGLLQQSNDQFPQVQKTANDTLALVERGLRQVKVMNRLIGDLLDGTRIQANKLNLFIDEYDLIPIVRDIVEDQRQISQRRTITLHIAETQEPLYVLADKDRIGQVISNYLTNALKYSAASASVTVGIEDEGQAARVWVRDQGPGLSSEQQQHVWDRYYQARGIAGQQSEGVGLGLGLHISKMLIQRHGGTVGVESTPGQGSTFWFSLPLANTMEH
ncbi:MAG TPA: PAS domain S-box protein [Dictyobacter sp.]|nr:PAS domain S-box protein [Dictyobacter sp.]